MGVMVDYYWKTKGSEARGESVSWAILVAF